MLIAGSDLLQRHAKLNRFFKINFFTCYFSSNGFIILVSDA